MNCHCNFSFKQVSLGNWGSGIELLMIQIPSCPNSDDNSAMIRILKLKFDLFLIKFDQIPIKIQLKCQLKNQKWSKLIEKVEKVEIT